MRAVLLVTLMVAFPLQAAEKHNERADYIRTHYAKYEFKIPMRDGKKLFTAVYIPNDRSQQYPMLMTRTPYSVMPYGVDRYPQHLGPSEGFEKSGYIFVMQDVRGRFMSEGTFVNMRPQHAQAQGPSATDDATDAYDTIDWLIKNIPNNNGKVGQWGISYPGYYTGVSAINAHPALKAISPQAPIADWFFDDFHRNGTTVTPMAFLFFDSFDKPRTAVRSHWPEPEFKPQTPDGYEFFLSLGPLKNINKNYFKHQRPFWDEIVAHPNYDQYWQARNVLQHYHDIQPATLVVGGWYDTEDLYGALATYQTMSEHNQRDNVRLVMGPWFHGQWNRADGSALGAAQFGFDTSKWFQEHIQLPFFNHYLKGEDLAEQPQVTVFETGANRWRQFASWPPQGKRMTWFLSNDQQLTQDKTAGTGFDQYVSDPNKPVPMSATINRGWDREYMAEDQRFAARRPDVLVYETKPFTQDTTIAGPITANLWFATDHSAADIVVKVVDIFPDTDENTGEKDKETGNRHELVRWGVIRGRFRHSFSVPEPFTPNKPTPVQFELYDVMHTLKRGHRLQIQIQSTMFPFLDLNPQHYVDNIFAAEDTDFVQAQHRIYHSAQYPSAVIFNTISALQ